MILNFTQHDASESQLQAGVVELVAFDKREVRKLLTVDELPSRVEIFNRAKKLAIYAKGFLPKLRIGQGDAVMIGGASWFMEPLVIAMITERIRPVFSFSKRESVDILQDDGTSRKVAIFKHLGFIDGCPEEEGWEL